MYTRVLWPWQYPNDILLYRVIKKKKKKKRPEL